MEKFGDHLEKEWCRGVCPSPKIKEVCDCNYTFIARDEITGVLQIGWKCLHQQPKDPILVQ